MQPLNHIVNKNAQAIFGTTYPTGKGCLFILRTLPIAKQPKSIFQAVEAKFSVLKTNTYSCIAQLY